MIYIRLFLAGALAGTLASPSAALGAWKRQSAALCRGPAYQNAANEGWALSEVGAVCPYDDDSLIPKGSLTTFNVHGEGPITVSACVKYWNASGGSLVGFACDSPSTSSGSGVFTLTPSIGTWQNVFNVGHFAYIKAVAGSPGTAYLYGWYSAF